MGWKPKCWWPVLEVIRQVADWLSGTVTDYQGNPQGLAVHLALITYDGSDTAPATPVVFDETRAPTVARDELPDGATVFTVSLFGSEWDAAYMSFSQDGRCTLLLRAGLENVNSAEAVRDSLYLLRAAKRSLLQLYRGENWQQRIRNGIAFAHDATQPLQIRPVKPEREDELSTWGLLAHHTVEEQEPE